MTDVRLTATNPADSTVVPVACNNRGELLTVAPVIEVIPNDVEVQGNLTVTGDYIGLPDVDSGLPAGGEEGQVLSIVDGVPTWVFFEPPEPPPPASSITLVDNYGASTPGAKNYGLYLDDGSLSPVDSNWDAWMRSFDCWDEPVSALRGLGLEKSASTNQAQLNLPFKLEHAGPAGVVLEVRCSAWISGNTPPSGDLTFEISSTNSNLIPITNKVQITVTEYMPKAAFTFLVNRPDLGVCDFTATATAPAVGDIYMARWACLQGYDLLDSATYIRRVLQQRREAQVLLP